MIIVLQTKIILDEKFVYVVDKTEEDTYFFISS